MCRRSRCISVLPHRLAFSLIELLVVLSILALILALLLPALTSSRHSAYVAACMSHLHHWGLALSAYLPDHRDTLPGEGQFQASSPPATWNPGQPFNPWNNLSWSAWYNALPPYLNAQRYGEIYDGSTPVGPVGGYQNNWILYCPARVREIKNSASTLNGCHYAMNATLNGSGSGNTLIDTLPTAQTQYYIRLSQIPLPALTLFMTEATNIANASIHNYARDRHYPASSSASANMLFLDAHVQLIRSLDMPRPAGPLILNQPYRNPDPPVIWGPFR